MCRRYSSYKTNKYALAIKYKIFTCFSTLILHERSLDIFYLQSHGFVSLWQVILLIYVKL